MLDDIFRRQHQDPASQWSQPSVLNCPPESSPMVLPRKCPSHIQEGSSGTEGKVTLLHHWFEQRILQNPEGIAIDYLTDLETGNRVQFTYRQVSNVATALAHKLLQRCSESAEPLQTVAVLMGPCPELYISYIAASKAGVAFCPIAMDAPRERREALMADLRPVALLTSSPSTESDTCLNTGGLSTHVIDVTSYLKTRDVEPTQLPQSSTTPDDIAYILYTSGTTGLPKGVAVSHLSALCTVSSLGDHFSFSLPPPDCRQVRWFQGAAPTFDISLFEIFWSLSSGSTLCCAPRHLTLQNIDRIVATLETDITNITPSFASLLDKSSIKGLMVGGETLNDKLLQDFAQWNPTTSEEITHVPMGIFNGYGPTETAIYCIAQAHVPKNQRGSVIGSPLATCGVLIVDQSRSLEGRALQPVPMGAVGELVVTGPQVSKFGYLNRPEETALSFIDDPQWGRAYKTGDRARVVWDHNGLPVIEFLGRISGDQVKINGRRVELGEIESVLASKAFGVKETIACVWKQGIGSGSEKIVSLVVAEDREDMTFEDVRQNCMKASKQHLPDFMRPFRMLEVDEIPRSTSGKADRKAAAGMVRRVLAEDCQGQAPSSNDITHTLEPLEDPEDVKLEEQLISIFQNALSHHTGTSVFVTPATVLADVGVDSLCAMRVLRDIRRRWPVSERSLNRSSRARLEPSLAVLLEANATIRSVFFPKSRDSSNVATSNIKLVSTKAKLEAFSTKHMSEVVDRLNLKNESDIETVLPATSTQSQLAVSFAIDKRNYISHTVLRLRSGVSASALKDAIEIVLSRQPIYRCAMIPCDDVLSPFVQAVLTREAWGYLVGGSSVVLHRGATKRNISPDPQTWLDLAERYLALESHRLYQIQIIESEDDNSSGFLTISVAHCICDGPSLEVLMLDIAREYAGLEPIQRQGIYEVVVEWASNVSPETDKLWQKQLEGWETEPLGAISGNNVKLPVAGARQHGMVQHTSRLPWQVLETKSRALGGSPLTILQAAWAMLLHILSEADTDDVTFGSVLSGHDQLIHAPTFSVVPCRVELPESQNLGQLISILMSHSRFAQGHRHTSFGVFKALPYNTALALQAYPSSDNGWEGVDLWSEMSNPAIRYDFSMFAEVFPTNPNHADRNGKFDDVVFKVTYREETLSKLSAACVAKQFANLTEVILSSVPDNLVQSLPARIDRTLLSAEGTLPVQEGLETLDASRRQVYERAQLLHAQFEDQAASTPDLQALRFYSSLDSPPAELSYAELDARANGLADILREQDIDIVPICMERSIELYVSILAILKAGSAWCPIDTTSPVQRRASLIARAQSKVLLTNTESLPLVEPCLTQEALKNVDVILVDQYADRKTHRRSKPRDSITSSRISGEDLAYLLWTSGTTGEPKGVMIQHSAAAQAMRDLQVQVEHDDREQVRTLQLSSYSFDVFVQDLFYTWGLAGSVISGTRELVLGTFTEFIWKSSPTHAHLTPSFGASIAVQELKGSSLQYVTFIGEKLTEDVAEAWAAPEITTRAYNTYGPAENAVVSTMRRFYGKSLDDAKAANVGLPLKHCTAYVVREVETSKGTKRWELVPRYGVGELALGGAQVAKGYLANEAKTTKAFIKGVAGINERIYLTGDLVRLNDHGFEFLGRNDDLVKITGIRIELSEISAACATLKDDDAAIEHVETLYLQRPGTPAENNNKVVVTFVSVKAGGVDTVKIRSQVFKRTKEMLPAYMVPGHVVVLNTTMPRTASNKVDRKALQAIYAESDLNVLAGRDDATISHSYDQAKREWTSEQFKILQTIASNFNMESQNLSPGDSLAGLGFSSLQVTKLAWLLRRELECQVGVLDLMRCESLGELVDVTLNRMPKSTDVPNTIEPQTAEASWLTSVKDALTVNIKGLLRPDDTTSILPATPMQESLIVETMLEPQAYWAHRVFDFSHLDEFDDRQLKRAWTVTAKRFDILRTIFVPLTQLDVEGSDSTVSWAKNNGVQSTILQIVRDKPAVRWIQLSSDEQRSLADVARTLQSELSPTTTVEPPWAVTFVESSKTIMLSMHHALYDAVASFIFLETVTKLYNMEPLRDEAFQFEKGLELGLLPPPAKRDEAAALWKDRFDEVSGTVAGGTLNAPFPDLTQSRQKQVQKILLAKKEIPSSLLMPSYNTSLPTLLQSAFGCVLASYLELDSIVLGHTVSQRAMHSDLSRVVGPAIATLPLIVRSNASSSEDLWKDMARDSARLFHTTHNLHPVDVKRMLNRGNGSSNAPFPGLFVYHPASDENEDSPIGHMFKEVGQALSLNVEHPLALNVFEEGKIIELTGDGRRISQPQLELLLHQVLEQARAMTECPKVPLAQLQNSMERHLLSVSGDITTEAKAQANPSDGVTLYASQHPDWIAIEEVVFEPSGDEEKIVTKAITYAQLDRLTNAIVSKLAKHEANLQPDDPVAMCLRRDIKSLAVTLAIFRAGFVYLPVDEDLPSARKQLLIQDAGAKLVITTDDLVNDLKLDAASGPPTLLLPDGHDDIEALVTCPVLEHRLEVGDGGYLLYTSGSTGRPKGVRVSNSNLCHFVSAFSTRLMDHSPATAKLGGVGKYLNLTSRAFDPHLTQLFVPWHLGHRVVIGKDRTTMMANLKELINELSITHFGSVPSVLTQLRLRPEDVPSVRVVTTGGEKASNELLNTWEKDSEAEDDKPVLFNFYGPTEVTIGCLGHAVNRDSNARNLGLPFQGLEALILCPGTSSHDLVIARRGQPGELCIAGPQVALGYLNRPIEQAKSFQAIDILGSNKRIYRTGDMMRMMNDGSLEFLGRADQQIKIRGQRLELDEVVGFLKQAAGDKDNLDFAAAVASSGDGSVQQQQLLGFVAKRSTGQKIRDDVEVALLKTNDQEATSTLDMIEQECQAKLPAFMVPKMVWVTRIPYLAASGKVDTKLLAWLASDFLATQRVDEQDDGLEQDVSTGNDLNPEVSLVIAAIEDALGVSVKANPSSSIHRLGIDSLSAVNLMSLLRKRGFSQVKMAHILASSCTVKDIANLADTAASSTDNNQVSTPTSTEDQQHLRHKGKALTVADLGPFTEGLDTNNIEAVLPCLPLQSALIARSLVWLSGYDGGSEGHDVPYVAQFNYRLDQNTDINTWERVAEEVIASEAILRTCFIQRDEDGQIFQIVLRSLPASPLQDDHPANIVAQMDVRPPVRLHVMRKPDGVTVSLKIHHALFDGVAIDSLKRKFEQCYENQGFLPSTGGNTLAVLSKISLHCNLTNDVLEATKRSWQRELRNVRACRVGVLDDNNTRGSMARSTLCLGYSTTDLNAKLKSGSDTGISTSSAFHLATGLCLVHLTQQPSIVYGFITSLRPLLDHVASDIDSFVGPCLNTIIRTLTLHDQDETLPQLVKRVHKPHLTQDTMPLVSVDKVQRWSGSEDKLFDSILSINVIPASDEATDGSKPGRMTALPTRSSSDMALAVDIDLHSDGKIFLTLSSAGALCEKKLGDIGRLFEKIVYSCADGDVKVSDVVPTLPAVEFISSTGRSDTESGSSELSIIDRDHAKALADVQETISRLLRLSLAEVSAKPESTSLYQLGIDSITVLPFVKQINKLNKTKLSSPAVIKARTIKGVAELLREARVKHASKPNGSHSISTVDPGATALSDTDIYDRNIARLARDLMFVATPLQEGMLSASLATGGNAYTYVHTIQLSSSALEIDNPNLDRFFDAVNDTVLFCEILRTRFMLTDDDESPWVGIVSPTEQSDLVNWEFKKSPPGRINLRIHHALYDATSIRAVWQILEEKYRRRLQGEPPRVDGSTKYLFRPFARTVASAQRASVAYWNDIVRDYTYTPIDFRGEELRASSAYQFSLNGQDLSLLQSRCQELGVTVKAALQLAWAKVLCESVYHQTDVIYGEVVSTDADDDVAIVGPTINTLPIRIKLGGIKDAITVSQALRLVQKHIDSVRGTNSMASLRKIQTQWRSNQPRDSPVGLFQSLFVFDGMIGSSDTGRTSSSLFTSVDTSSNGSAGPAYDDYPLIVSFNIKDNRLNGKVRAKLSEEEVKATGEQLVASLKHVLHGFDTPALDMKHLRVADKAVLTKSNIELDRSADLNGLTPIADAVLNVVESVVGTRRGGKRIGYNTRLISIGLDSILAIRLSKLLKEKVGLNVSVFEIMKGASVRDIVKRPSPSGRIPKKETGQKPSNDDEGLRKVMGTVLEIPEGCIESVLPALSGQRSHLEQWVLNGKRFFEPPWAYKIDTSFTQDIMMHHWAKLVHTHNILRTTFACGGNGGELYQVTLNESWPSCNRFTVVQDSSKTIEVLIYEHVDEENMRVSDLKEPPARFSFLEGSDGKAIVLRLHHALYDGWSIKMIEKDLTQLLSSGKIDSDRPSLQQTVRQIQDIRQRDAEATYWKQYLSHAEATIVGLGDTASPSPCGPQIKATLATHSSQTTIDLLSTKSNSQASAAIILAYAKTLEQMTHKTRPTFGLNHASRSLSSPDGTQTLDLTNTSVPTLTVTPVSVDLAPSVGDQLAFIQDHLAQLTLFAQADGISELSPRFNSYLNIIHLGGTKGLGDNDGGAVRVLRRYRLPERLASSYFTTTEPSSTVSTIDELDTSHLCAHRFFFNVFVGGTEGIKITVSADEGLFGTNHAMVHQFVRCFGDSLEYIVKGLD